MSDKIAERTDDDMSTEYDFAAGARGKHRRAYHQGIVVTVRNADGTYEERLYNLPEGAVILDADVRPYFPDAGAVNRALRGLIDLIPRDSASEPAEAVR